MYLHEMIALSFLYGFVILAFIRRAQFGNMNLGYQHAVGFYVLWGGYEAWRWFSHKDA